RRRPHRRLTLPGASKPSSS
ncbi:hypothetical protein AB1N83_013567, partial [Pleurotus pulmonarius]